MAFHCMMPRGRTRKEPMRLRYFGTDIAKARTRDVSEHRERKLDLALRIVSCRDIPIIVYKFANLR